MSSSYFTVGTLLSFQRHKQPGKRHLYLYFDYRSMDGFCLEPGKFWVVIQTEFLTRSQRELSYAQFWFKIVDPNGRIGWSWNQSDFEMIAVV